MTEQPGESRRKKHTNCRRRQGVAGGIINRGSHHSFMPQPAVGRGAGRGGGGWLGGV